MPAFSSMPWVCSPLGRRVLRIGLSLAAVVAAYGAYAFMVVPFIEPPVALRPATRTRSPAAAPIDVLGLRDMFRPGDWELEERTTILESDSVKLLVQDYTNLPDHASIELRRCTVVFTPMGGSADETQRNREAVILQASEGAMLQFDRPLDLRRGSIGRLKAGRLNGSITIRSAGKHPGPEDDLLAVTRDIQVTEQGIWTPHPVEFSLGRNTGRGSELQIRFVPGDEGGAGKRHGLSIAGIESVEVRRIERIHLEAGADPSHPGAFSSAESPKTPPDHQPIEVTCRGPFRFDLGQQLATFEEQVDLVRVAGPGPSDQINCEWLGIQFARRRDAAVVPGSGTESASPTPLGLPQFQARRIEARGNPVVLRAPSHEAEARGEHLQYDLLQRQLTLDGTQEVFLKQGPNEIHARRLRYQLGAVGRLGVATAEGPGWLRGQFPNRPGLPLQARWKGLLRLQPDEDRQHVVSLTGDAVLEYPMLGQLAASEIFLWLSEASAATLASGQSKRPVLQPDRMLARGQVQLQTAQLSGAVAQLEVWFEPPAPGAPGGSAEPRGVPAPEPGPAAASNQAGAGGNGVEGAWSVDRLAQHAGPAALLVSSAAPSPTPSSSPTPGSHELSNASNAAAALGRHFHMEGDVLRVRLVGQQDRAEIAELIAEGRVQLVETRTAQPGQEPLRIQGERVHVVDAGQAHAAVSITGNPARFEGRGLALEGSNLNLNAGTDRVWIEGPGRLRLTVDQDLHGRPLDHPALLVLLWQQRMDLTGRRVVFQDSVVATLQDQTLRTEALEVGFHEPIRLAEPGRSTRPQVDTIVCRGHAVLEGRETDPTGTSSVQRIDVNELAIDRQSGAVRAVGPGRVTTVRRSAPDWPLSSTEPSHHTLPNPDPQNLPLVCLRVRFRREVTGNLQLRQMVFHEQVHVLYGPVASWEATIPDDGPEALGPHGVVLRCDRLSATQLPVPGTQLRAWALEATGNAVAEGQNFTARALRMTYDQAKGVLVLEGDGRTDAALFLQERPGHRPITQQSRRIRFWPATKRVELEGFRSLEIPNLPNNPPGRR